MEFFRIINYLWQPTIFFLSILILTYIFYFCNTFRLELKNWNLYSIYNKYGTLFIYNNAPFSTTINETKFYNTKDILFTKLYNEKIIINFYFSNAYTSSINLSFILSISVKNKLIPRSFSFNILLKLDNIIFSNFSET